MRQEPARTLLAALWLLAASDAIAAGLTASLDRNPIRADETVRLVLEVDERVSDVRPDLSALDADFEPVGAPLTSTQVRFVEGRQSATTRWTVELAPRRTGTLAIPAIAVGEWQSPPITLEVHASAAADAGTVRDVLVELEAMPSDPYVQQQVTVTVRLLRSVEILDGRLPDPDAGDAPMLRLGRDLGFTREVDGTTYRVIERRYAVFPRASGSLRIPPVRFEGEVAGAGQASGSAISRLTAGGRRVRVASGAVELRVRPRPDAFDGPVWLPASTLGVIEEWPEEPPRLRVGEPVTRTLAIRAAGLRGDQVPDLELEAPAHAKSYPDQPTSKTATDSTWVHGMREQRIALVATRPGPLVLPEIRVRWWDTARDAERVAVVPARTLEVAAAPAPAPEAAVDETAPRPPAPAASATEVVLLRAATGALLGLWLITAWVWLRGRRKGAATDAGDREPASERAARGTIRDACQRGDPVAARRALLDLARAKWPDARLHGLAALAARLGPGQASRALEALDRALYAPGGETWDGPGLWRVIEPALRGRSAAAPGGSDALPPLNP